MGYTRVPYRNRIKPTIKLTTTEKKERSEKFQAKKSSKVDMLKKTGELIWKEAVKMSETLGKSPHYWYEHIIHVNTTPPSVRHTNLWNVYLSIRGKELNEGRILSISPFCLAQH